MDNIKHISLYMPFRDDYNGRPIYHLFDNYGVLITHPFYCWYEPKYGRVYKYNIIDNNSFTINHKFNMYCYDSAALIIDTLLNQIISDVIDNNFDNKKYNFNNFEFNIVKNNNYKLPTLIRKIKSAKQLSNEFNDDFYGFITFNDTYLIWANLMKYYNIVMILII